MGIPSRQYSDIKSAIRILCNCVLLQPFSESLVYHFESLICDFQMEKLPLKVVQVFITFRTLSYDQVHAYPFCKDPVHLLLIISFYCRYYIHFNCGPLFLTEPYNVPCSKKELPVAD